VIDATEIFDIAIGEIACQVAGPVQTACAQAIGVIVDKTIGRESGSIQIPRATPAPPTYISPVTPIGNQTSVAIEQTQLQIRDRASDDTAPARSPIERGR